MEEQRPIRPIILSGLLDARSLNALPWKTLREGIQFYSIYGEPGAGPAAALLRYQPGARLPRHLHEGYEHILVLAQNQRDDSGLHQAGTLVVNPPGSQHTVQCPEGGIVLAIWEKPVSFVEPSSARK